MKLRSKIFPCLVIISFIAGILVTPEAGEASEPVIIGVPHWEKFSYATMMKNSFEMALSVINEAGGIKGRPLKLVYADDQGKRDAGEKIVKELVKRAGAVMMVGGYASSNTVYTARMANKLDIPFLVCTAADDRITQRKWRNVYRMNPPASEYTKGLEDFFLHNIKPKSMAILYENSPYGTGSALRMMWFCREHDIEIRKIIPYHKERAHTEAVGSTYFQRLIAPLKDEPPDVIYMVSYLKDAALLVKEIRALKINALLSGGAGGFTHPKMIKMAGDAANNLLTATLWFNKVCLSSTAYCSRYVEKYSIKPDYHGAEAYSALLVAADALNRAESFSSKDIRAALDKTDLKTPFGPVKFKSYGNFQRQNSLPTMVLQINQGQFDCVWPENLATSKFTPPRFWRGSD
jgi:branched-chain amino acid transport system substrate-binding protein